MVYASRGDFGLQSIVVGSLDQEPETVPVVGKQDDPVSSTQEAEREKDDGDRAEAALAFPGGAPAQTCYYYSAKWIQC